MRRRIFEIIDTDNEKDIVGNIYDWFMMIVIIASVIPLAFKSENTVFYWIDKIAAIIFIIDYLLRLITADYKLSGRRCLSYLKYPFTPMAIIDLISILPSVTVLNAGFRLFRMFRLIRTFRVFRVFKAARYSKSVKIVTDVLQRQKESLTTVFMFAVGYILISALIIFNVEPETFETFFDAVYWATISLTTMGYGDIYPVTGIGRVVTMLSSLVGIAIVALPASIITAGYMEVVEGKKNGDD